MEINKIQSMRLRQRWLNSAITIGSFTFFVENSGNNNADLSYLFLISMTLFIISMTISSYLVLIDILTFHNDEIDKDIDEINKGISLNKQDKAKLEEELEEDYYKATQNLEKLSLISTSIFSFGIFFALWNIHTSLAVILLVITPLVIFSVRRQIKAAFNI
ncbi:hypothetical protein MIS45_04265 [Wielerella bovis]|uniref:hypothetical protein n=1 Tax=Wielerella bovis TaxID=2917790 RepID=UPI0020198948|nr:hypothetical protein [Wielerella bovis]ULJ70046.1 hypothetical protein MIS45_04265 [Wielerella bovis]